MVAAAGPSHPTPIPPQELLSLLANLADQLVASRLDSAAASVEAFDPQPYLAQSAPLFAALHGVNRNNLLQAKECRTRTQDARLEMDSAHLRLQNLLFERNHLEREIRSCEEYSSEYQNLPLHSVDELRELAAQENPPAGLPVPLPAGDTEESAHELMLARLAFELAERKRFEEERKSLGVAKAKLIKENEVKKARLEDLEKQLTEFVEIAESEGHPEQDARRAHRHLISAMHSLSPSMFRRTLTRMAAYNGFPATLPKLPYAYDALQPAISAQIMELHHSKHHATYVANLNKAVEDLQASIQAQDIKKQIALQAAIKFNGGGHINHTLFWENLAPTANGGGKFPSSGPLAEQVEKDFGGLDGLKKALNAAALGIQGSGWAWLGYNPTTKKLEVVSTANQDPLLGYVPLIGIDMWEHAFYLDYKNVKQSYLDAIYGVINWEVAEKRLASA